MYVATSASTLYRLNSFEYNSILNTSTTVNNFYNYTWSASYLYLVNYHYITFNGVYYGFGDNMNVSVLLFQKIGGIFFSRNRLDNSIISGILQKMLK